MKRQVLLSGRRIATVSSALVLATASIVPMLLPQVAQAQQMSRRRIEMSTSVVGVAATGDITFQMPTSTDVTGIEVELVDSPLGNYATLPANVPSIGGSPTVALLDGSSTSTLSGVAGTAVNGDSFRAWTNTGAFTITGGAPQNGDGYTGGGSPNNQLQLTRTTGTSETVDSSAGTNVHALRITGLTNNATVNTTFFARIRVYTGGTTTTLVHDGTVAGATAQVLAIQARVQEVLQFCIGAETSANVSAWTGVGTNCSNVTGTLVDLGAIDSAAATVSPVSAGNNVDGVAMLRTNAVNGATVTYKSMQDLTAGGSNRGSLKVVGQTCSSTDISSGSKTDRCFNSTTAGNPLTATATEGFGMRLVNADSASETPTANFSATSPYGSATDYSWDDTGASVLVASSTGATEKIVDDEAFQLRFAARSALTTPTGQYSVAAQFIAAPVY
jgi:hypothetical protein